MARLLLIDVPTELQHLIEQEHEVVFDERAAHDLIILGSRHLHRAQDYAGPTLGFVEPEQLPELTEHLSRCDDFLVPPNAPTELLSRIAGVLSRSAHRDLQIQEMRSNLAKDPLTGLPNRQVFEESALRTLSQAGRSGSETSVCMVDIDYFKQVNDQYGHLAGDAAIVAVVEQCRQRLRQHDVICRFGGDEIVILLPDTTCEQATGVASQLCDRIRRTPVIFGDQSIPITLSIGVASHRPNGVESKRNWHSDYEQLLAAADHALYQAKEAGRDCARNTTKTSVER